MTPADLPAPERCPTCDRDECPMFPTPPVHEEEPRDKCPGCVAMYDCDTHRRAREDGMRAAAARWAKVAPLIERLADDVRRRELIARAEFDRRVSDTVTDLLAATQEPTP